MALLLDQIRPEDGVWLITADRPGIWSTLNQYINEDSGPNPVITITSGRYVSITGVPGLYDTADGVWIADPPARWFEVRVFNIRELVRVCTEKTKRTRHPAAE
jgi:hypothetical protein